jgi:glycosyltransferase involved in cell wall biosynthesis
MLWQLFYFAEGVMLWRHCRSIGARHVHCHHGSSPADVALLATHLGARSDSGPITWSMTLHGPIELWNTRWYRLPEKIRAANGVICISDFGRSQAMALVDEAHWSKLHVVHCGVIPERYDPACTSSAARGAAGRILCVGRLVPEKGQAILISALGLLLKSGCEAELVLVGDGPSANGLARLAEQLDVAEHVTFTGSMSPEQVEHQYASASVFCSSSFSEGLPVVLMEALASGCPTVSTAIAGVPELIRDGESGLLVAPGRAEPLAEAIRSVLEDKPFAQRLACAGRDRVAADFDVRRSAARLDRFFAEMTQPCAERVGASKADTDSDTAILPRLITESSYAKADTTVPQKPVAW